MSKKISSKRVSSGHYQVFLGGELIGEIFLMNPEDKPLDDDLSPWRFYYRNHDKRSFAEDTVGELIEDLKNEFED